MGSRKKQCIHIASQSREVRKHSIKSEDVTCSLVSWC